MVVERVQNGGCLPYHGTEGMVECLYRAHH
jgi:hypothetical protein